MKKTFCDCCGKEFSGQSMPIEVPCHHYSLNGNVVSGYEDSEGNRVSGRYDKIDLCNKCSNEVFGSAMKKFYELKSEVWEKDITTGDSVPIVVSEPHEEPKYHSQKRFVDTLSAIRSMTQKEYDDLWKEACETQKKMDEEAIKLHEGMTHEEILDYNIDKLQEFKDL